MERSSELKESMKRIYEAFGRGDITPFEDLITQNEGVLAIGTDPKEWWSGRQTILDVFQAQLEETGGFELNAGELEAYKEGDVGWVADQPAFQLPDGSTLPVRVTAVFHKEGDNWKVVQWHASIGVANEEVFGESLTT